LGETFIMKIEMLLCCLALSLSVPLCAAERQSDRPSAAPEKISPTDEARLKALRKLLPELLTRYPETDPRIKEARALIADLEQKLAHQNRESPTRR
jgi:hypothetical protein